MNLSLLHSTLFLSLFIFLKKMLSVILIIYKTVFKARGTELFIQDQLDMQEEKYWSISGT